MAELKIDRRQLLKLGISAGVLATLPFKNVVLADAVSDELLSFVSDDSLPVDATRTGLLTQADVYTLATLCTYVNETWELSSDLGPYLVALKADLVYKTREEPSYLTEYEHAIELINAVAAASESMAQAWTTLLFSEISVNNWPHTKLARARTFVFEEIIAHQIPISGAFKSFGLINYRGYRGGPFTSPSSYKRGEL